MSRSQVSLVYNQATNRYVSEEELYQFAIFQYQEPQGTDGETFSGNSQDTYPLNTEVFSNIDTSFDEINHEIELPKGDYLIEGYITSYHNASNTSIKMKLYVRVESSATDLSGACSSNLFYVSQNNQSDYRMNEIAPWINYFSLTERSTIKLIYRHAPETGSTGTQYLGRNADVGVPGGDNLPEIYGSFKFTKVN